MCQAIFLIVTTSLAVIEAALPNGCVPLEEHPFSVSNPAEIFGANSEIQQKSKPINVGNLRESGAVPTGHFVTNAIKNPAVPIRLIPYEAFVSDRGITYDAYTMERWSDPTRTDLMQEQTPAQPGKDWDKLLTLGTNMKQTVAGPDGNPRGAFFGTSGVRIGINGSGQPVLTDFGDLYANFMYSANGGSMEVPLVRGSAMLTHIFKNADPVIKPYCLSSINGHSVQFSCPEENSMADIGSGYISGTCNNDELLIRLDTTKPIRDLTKIQYAACGSEFWRQNHTMHQCTTQNCRLSNNGHSIDIHVSGATGKMAYAINYIGHYVLPWDWINTPEEVSCPAKRSSNVVRMGDAATITIKTWCDYPGFLFINVNLGNNMEIPGIAYVQYAVSRKTDWNRSHVMRGCSFNVCKRQGNIVTIKIPAPENHVRLAVNVVLKTTMPHFFWAERPYDLICNGQTMYSEGHENDHFTFTMAPPMKSTILTTQAPITPKPTQTSTQTPSTPRLTTQTPSTPSQTTPKLTTPSPTTNHENDLVNSLNGTMFIMELNEPGNALPFQTRKFKLYFSQPVKIHVEYISNTITFSSVSGGRYTGIMQLAYLGAGRRGDKTNDTIFSQHYGVYSYKPMASYCVNDAYNKVFTFFDWRVNRQYAPTNGTKLLMVAMPHHVLQVTKQNIIDTVFGFKGLERSDWLLEMNLPRASMEPNMTEVVKIKRNSQQSADIVSAINRDASEHNIDTVCDTWDSYDLGKALGLSARLASISRAFGTDHFQAIDSSLKTCLEKWLRIQDTLPDKWKFHYDLVWGGLFLRASNREMWFADDHGYPYYNDHHLQLGYYLYAMAYYIQHYPEWGKQHKERIYTLARDVGNPSYKDKYFPVMRHKDVYMGFSWSTGVVPGERLAESSSEALNCYHGLAALGYAFNDSIMTHTGQMALAMEIASVREYFHVRDHNLDHFPPLLRKYGAVGMIGEDEFYVYSLNEPCVPNLFPMRHACVIGRQILPITAVSKYWMDKEWAAHVKDTCSIAINPTTAPEYHLANQSEITPLDSGWAAACYAGRAPYNETYKQQAAMFLRDKGPRQLVRGTGAASTLLFIYGQT